MVNRLDPFLDRVAGRSDTATLHRISRGYVAAAWVTLALAIVAWPWFAASAVGFYVAAIRLRRERL